MTENTTKASPLTLEELKEPLTLHERQEMDNPFFIRQLNMFIDGINRIPNINPRARYNVTEQLRDHVKQRSAVKQAIIENPDIAKNEINPVIIIGLPRSGTTMLHRLLSCDPRFVAPMAFELLQPCPPGRPENWRGTERYRKAQEYMGHMYPGGLTDLRHMHEVNMDLPDECYYITQACLIDNGWGTVSVHEKLRQFTYSLPEDISVKVYEHYKNALKCIFYKGLKEDQVPLLKAPIHTLYIDTCMKAFPNAKFIFPYRNAVDMVASCCSLSEKFAHTTLFEIDKLHSTRASFDFYKLGSSRVVNAAKKTSKDRLLPVSYSEMVQDPLAVVQEIYANFGWEVTPQMMENMQRHLQENKQHKHGKHTYNLEEFGISKESLKTELREYLDYFGAKEDLL